VCVFGEFRDELLKLGAGELWLLLAQGRQRQQNLRKRPQVMAMIGGDRELLEAYSLVAVDSSEAKEKPPTLVLRSVPTVAWNAADSFCGQCYDLPLRARSQPKAFDPNS
jgi:hypothetical protein